MTVNRSNAIVGITCLALLLIVPEMVSAEIEGLYFADSGPDTEDVVWEPIDPPQDFCPWRTPSDVSPGFGVRSIPNDDGDVSSALVVADGLCADLGRGETIALEISAPDEEPNHIRSFVLVTHGRYEHGEGRLREHAENEMATRLSASAYPNPFTPTTRIRFEMPAPGGDVSVRVFNIAGRLVRDLGEGDLRPGVYELEWDGRDDRGEQVAAGVYFYSIQTRNEYVQRKMVLLR